MILILSEKFIYICVVIEIFLNEVFKKLIAANLIFERIKSIINDISFIKELFLPVPKYILLIFTVPMTCF